MKITVVGACGRMGREVIRMISTAQWAQLCAALEHPSSPFIGKDAGEVAGIGTLGVKVSFELPEVIPPCDCVVDFSTPRSTMRLLDYLEKDPRPAVIATTGLDNGIYSLARRVSRKVAVVISANFSIGIAIMRETLKSLVGIEVLDDFDIEIVEFHHREKKDAPSGTALELAAIVSNARKIALQYGREGKNCLRGRDEVGMHAVRGGTAAGEHSVFFLGNGERIELKHIAENRSIFAMGALKAVRWTLNVPPGLYSINDVLGLSSEK